MVPTRSGEAILVDGGLDQLRQCGLMSWNSGASPLNLTIKHYPNGLGTELLALSAIGRLEVRLDPLSSLRIGANKDGWFIPGGRRSCQ